MLPVEAFMLLEGVKQMIVLQCHQFILSNIHHQVNQGGGASAPQHYQAGDTSLNLKTVRLARRPRLFHLEEVAGYLADPDVIVSS